MSCTVYSTTSLNERSSRRLGPPAVPSCRRLLPLVLALATLSLAAFGQTIPNSGQILQ